MLLTAFFMSSISLPQLFPCSHHHPMQLSSSAIFLSSLMFVFISPMSSLATTTLRSPHLSPRRLSYSCSVALLSSDCEMADFLMIFHLTSGIITAKYFIPPPTLLLTWCPFKDQQPPLCLFYILGSTFLGTVQCSNEIANRHYSRYSGQSQAYPFLSSSSNLQHLARYTLWMYKGAAMYYWPQPVYNCQVYSWSCSTWLSVLACTLRLSPLSF